MAGSDPVLGVIGLTGSTMHTTRATRSTCYGEVARVLLPRVPTVQTV